MHTPHTRAYCNPSHNVSLAGSVALLVRVSATDLKVTGSTLDHKLTFFLVGRGVTI